MPGKRIRDARVNASDNLVCTPQNKRLYQQSFAALRLQMLLQPLILRYVEHVSDAFTWLTEKRAESLRKPFEIGGADPRREKKLTGGVLFVRRGLIFSQQRRRCPHISKGLLLQRDSTDTRRLANSNRRRIFDTLRIGICVATQ